MFSGILPLIFFVFLIGAAAALNVSPFFPSDPATALLCFAASIPLFFLVLFIEAKTKWARNLGKERFLFLVNIEWALAVAFFIFFLGSHRAIFLWFHPFGQTAFAILLFTLYFIILYLAVYWLENKWSGKNWAKGEAGSGVRFLIPFSIPFIALILLNDIFDSAQQLDFIAKLQAPYDILLYGSAAALAVAFLILLHPRLAVKIWRSPPLKDQELMERMEALCKKAGFTHSGIKEWPVKNRSLTAAIIGMASWSRYVLFSPKLLEVASRDASCAILAHEIGHWRHRHLLIYPFIIFEIIALSLLSASLLLEPLQHYISADQTPLDAALIHAGTFAAAALCMGLFFRLIFGYFSRLFERQADLFPLKLGIPADHVIEALDTIATAAGNIHTSPSWHHCSIAQRIDFLNAVKADPSMIEKHSRKVVWSLAAFCVAFAVTVYFVFTL